MCFFFNDTATTEIYTLSLHDALPICRRRRLARRLSHVLIAAGLLLLAEAAVTYLWGDPVTSLYTRYEQRALADDYADAAERFTAAAGAIEAPPPGDGAPAAVPAALERRSEEHTSELQ